MPVDPGPINTTITNNIFTNNSGKITAVVLSGVLFAITAWVIANFAAKTNSTEFLAANYTGDGVPFCDGNHHFLGDVTSYKSVITTGWTEAQWRAGPFPWLPAGTNPATAEMDSIAITAAVKAGKATGKPYTMRVTGNCLDSIGMDMTVNTIKNVVHDFTGSNIYSRATGRPVADYNDNQFTTVIGLYITGDATQEPYSGMRFMRTVPGTATGNNLIIRPHTDGSFTHACREMSVEVTTVIKPLENNQDANGGRCLYLDPQNQFNAGASEVYKPFTIGVNSGNAMTNYVQIGGSEVCATCDAPVYINGGLGPQFLGFPYFNNNNPITGHKFAVYLYYTTALPLEQPIFDIRAEAYNPLDNNGFTAGMTGEFFLDADHPTVTMAGFSYRTFSDWSCQGSGATPPCGSFVTSNAVTSVSVQDFSAHISGYAALRTPPIFADPAKWSGAVDIHLPWPENMPTVPAVLSGQVCSPVCVTFSPTPSLTKNVLLQSDQPNEHTAVTPVSTNTPLADLWRFSGTGGFSGKTTYQDAAAFSCDSGNYWLNMTVAAAVVSPAATDSIGMYTSVPASELQQVMWDRGNSNPITFVICLQANFTGNVPLYVVNPGGTEIWVHDLALPAVINTNKKYFVELPPWVSPTKFSVTPNNVAFRVGLNFLCGSNFVFSADVYTAVSGVQSGCTSASTNAAATIGNSLSLSYILAFPGNQAMPLQPEDDAGLTQHAQRSFFKTFPVGTTPAQNAGSTGAFRFTVDATGAATSLMRFPFQLSNGGVFGTAKFFSTHANSANCWDITAAADGGAASASNITQDSMLVSCAGSVAGHTYEVHATVAGAS